MKSVVLSDLPSFCTVSLCRTDRGATPQCEPWLVATAACRTGGAVRAGWCAGLVTSLGALPCHSTRGACALATGWGAPGHSSNGPYWVLGEPRYPPCRAAHHTQACRAQVHPDDRPGWRWPPALGITGRSKRTPKGVRSVAALLAHLSSVAVQRHVKGQKIWV